MKRLDSNKNGIVNHSDFLDLLKELKSMRGWGDAEPRLKECGKALDNAWNALKQGADTDQDQAVRRFLEQTFNTIIRQDTR